MAILPAAKPSPRIVEGVIYWYKGDTFQIDLALNIKDQDGESIDIQPQDIVKIVFFGFSKSKGDTIAEIELEGIQNNVFSLNFTEELSRKFDRGVYLYDIYLTHNHRTTIVNDNIVKVE